MPRVLRHSLNIKRHSSSSSVLASLCVVAKGPSVNLNEVLQPSLDDETELRRLLATDGSELSNPYIGVVNVFEAPSDIRTTRARVVKVDRDLNAKHVMPIPEDKRRKEGEPCMVSDLDEFKRN
ncbi:hypothetical protein F5887DRAFT_666142 [Amanita rubescens]|nr:hypothetical protein F5887DRAFT_666142 [Amanita rubescens]